MGQEGAATRRRRRGPPGDGLLRLIEGSEQLVDRLFRHESGRAVASLIRVFGDIDAAEEAVQEAFVVALERWPADGVPDNPGAWVTRVARNKAIDRLRRERVLEQKKEVLEGLERLAPREAQSADAELEGEAAADAEMPDDRLRLILTCCHPALAPEARIALTLRLLGGLTTAEIASAFLTSEAAMAKRLVRAKRKIRDARIPYAVPGPDQLPERMPSVLSTLYLIFNEGYYASRAGPLVRVDLADEAIRLARVLAQILPSEPEARALLALLLIQHSRREARVDASGEMVLLSDQDRTLWDRSQIQEAGAIAEDLGPSATGPYALQAAIAAEHARAERAEDTDWGRIGRLYGRLSQVQPSPVVELNRAVAIAMDEGPEAGLELIDAIAGLDAYQPFHASRADLLRRADREAEAASSYRRALELTENPIQRSFIERRIEEVEPTGA